MIRGGKEGRTVALRADIDALAISETSSKPYCSVHDGVMHACGHDGHTAILLGTALILQEARQNLEGNVKLFFQPAEESTGGAERMIKAGCLEDPKVDYVFGLHMNSTYPTGKIKSRAGAVNASGDTYEVTVLGSKAHGAKPDQGRDAIVAASSIVLELQTIVSRRISPQDSVVLTVGRFKGGTANNVIADKVTLGMTLRTLNEDIRKKANAWLRNIVEQASAMHGVKAEINHEPGYMVLRNDPNCVELIKELAEDFFGQEAFSYIEKPSLGCEDFGYFCQDIPGGYYELGCRNEELGITAEIHTSNFDLDPDSLALGLTMQTAIVFSLLGAKSE